MLKVLDVNSLQAGIDFAVKDIEKFTDQIGGVQKAVYHFHSLDDALKGKGGEAIRAFYQYCHEPFLIFLHQSLIDYKSILSEMKDAVNSLEVNEQGFVSQYFLENEMKNGLNKVEKKAVELTDDANSIIESVQGLVSIDKIDESALVEDVRRGKNKADDIVEKLHALDDEQVKALETVKENLQFMKSYLSEIEAKFQNGDLTIEDFSITAISDVEEFGVITENVYGEEGIIGLILNKYQDGKPITALESDTLYEYFQTEVLDENKRKELEEIADFINEKYIEKLTGRLNEKVVISDNALEEEMVMVQAYLFYGTNKPGETGIDYDERRKLEAYLMLLKNFHTHMVKDSNVILVKDIKFEEDYNDITGYFLSSEIELNKYNTKDGIHEMYDLKDKNDYRDWAFFNSDYPIIPEYLSTKVLKATGRSAANNIDDSELNKLKEEEANYEANFVVKEVIGKIFSGLAKKLDISDFIDALEIASRFGAGKEESENKIKVEDALNTARRLNLEVSISEMSHGKELNIQLYPLDATFEKISRWEILHEIEPSIPFPQEAINAHDWKEIGKELSEIEDQFGSELTDYIQDDSDESAEDLVDRLFN